MHNYRVYQDHPTILSLIHILHDHCQLLIDKKIPGYELAIKANIMLLLYQLSSKNLLLTHLNFLKSNTLKLKNLFTFINEHYADPITIKDASKIYGCSPSNFMRFF